MGHSTRPKDFSRVYTVATVPRSPSLFPRKSLACLLIAALTACAPGLGCYEALASAVAVQTGVQVQAVPGGAAGAGFARLSPGGLQSSVRLSPAGVGLGSSLKTIPTLSPVAGPNTAAPAAIRSAPTAPAAAGPAVRAGAAPVVESAPAAARGAQAAAVRTKGVPSVSELRGRAAAREGESGAPSLGRLLSDRRSFILPSTKVADMPHAGAHHAGRKMMDRILGIRSAAVSKDGGSLRPHAAAFDSLEMEIEHDGGLRPYSEEEIAAEAGRENGKRGLSRKEKSKPAARQDPNVFSPATSLGQLAAGVVNAALSYGAYTSGLAYLAMNGWVQYAGMAMLGLSAFSAVAAAGFLILGVRVALSKAGDTEAGDQAPMRPPYKFFGKHAFRKVLLRPIEGDSPVYIPRHAARPLQFHKKLRAKTGWIGAYALQGLSHFRYLFGEIVSTLRGVFSIGKLIHGMYKGDAEVSPFVKNHRKMVYLLQGINIAQAVLGVTISYVIGALVDSALAKDPATTAALTAGILAIAAVNLVLNTVYGWVKGRLGGQVLRDFRVHLFGHVLRLPFSFISREKPSAIAARLNTDVAQLSAKNIDIPVVLPYYGAMAAVAVAMMAWTSWQLSLVVAATVPLLALIAAIYGNKAEKLNESQMNRQARMIGTAEGILTNARDVRGFSAEEIEVDRYAGRADSFLGTVLKRIRLASVYNGLMGQLYNVFFHRAVLIPGLFMFIYFGAPTVGGVMAMAGYAGYLRTALAGFLSLYTRYRETTGSAKRVLKYLAKEPAVKDAPDAADPGRLEGRLEFKDVSFSQEGRAALRGVTFAAEPGEKIAIVGSDGSGAESVLDLALRLNDPAGGSVRFDGKDARGLKMKGLRKRIILLHENGLWLSGTLRDNLRYGLEREVSDDEIRAALGEAGAHFADSETLFPEGLDTRLTADDWRLGGGRRKILEVARAILHDPSVVLLDRAASGLDRRPERIVRKSLDRLTRDRTSLIVDHDIRTARGADKIIVMDEGRVVESGTHDELMAKKGRYYELINAQVNKREKKAAEPAGPSK